MRLTSARGLYWVDFNVVRAALFFTLFFIGLWKHEVMGGRIAPPAFGGGQ